MMRLPREVFPLYAIVFIDVIGFTFLIPLLPELGKHFGGSSFEMGLLISATALCAAVSSPAWGYLSDRIGRKKVLLSSQCFTLGGYLLIALAGSIPMLFLSRVVAGLGGGNLGVAQSYIVDVVEPRDRQRALAWGTAAFGLGFVVGPLLSGLLLKFGLNVPFWFAAGLETLNIVFTVFVLRDAPRQTRGDSSRRSLLDVLLEGRMLNLMARQFLYIFAFTYLFTLFGLYLDRRLHIDAAGAALLLAAAGTVGAVTLIFGVDHLGRRFGDFGLSQIAFVVAFLAYVLVGFVTSLPLFAIVLVLWAASGAALRPTLNKLIAEAAPPNRRGAMLGFADSLSNASMIVAPAAGSAIIGADPRLAGILPALCVAGAFILGVWTSRRG
jgi:DHA1 family tetracycline resistance protein-like MFS transporter